MWGGSAVGKLVKGADPLKPGIEVFVDEEAGSDVAEKVRRRLQHFIDRKVAAAIREFGFRVPILAKSDKTVVDGHLRLKRQKN